MASHYSEGANNKNERQRLIHYRINLQQEPRFPEGCRSDLITSMKPCRRFSLNTKNSKLPRESRILGDKRRHSVAVFRQVN
jgi:hypothetical protein